MVALFCTVRVRLSTPALSLHVLSTCSVSERCLCKNIFKQKHTVVLQSFLLHVDRCLGKKKRKNMKKSELKESETRKREEKWRGMFFNYPKYFWRHSVGLDFIICLNMSTVIIKPFSIMLMLTVWSSTWSDTNLIVLFQSLRELQ